MDPILEGLVTTLDPDGTPHLAPMGPRISCGWQAPVVTPISHLAHLSESEAHGEGVLHVTDDALLLAKAAIRQGPVCPPIARRSTLRGVVLTDSCRYGEFMVRSIDESGERVQIHAEIIYQKTLRDFWGFNRAKHAVIEAAILATRLHLIPHQEVAAEYAKLRIIVDKTGGPAEHEAFDFLCEHLERSRA